MIDWWLQKVEAFDAQFVVPHVTQLTLTIRAHSPDPVALGQRLVMLTLSDIIAQFPALTKLDVVWILEYQSYRRQVPPEMLELKTALVTMLSPLIQSLQEINLTIRPSDTEPAEIGHWDHKVV